MKNFTLLFISILIFSSCEKFDDPIPDGSLLETPTLIANLVGSDKVSLIWGSDSTCAGECPSFVPATYYEIWTRSLTSSTNYKLGETPAGETSFLVEGLEPGVKQEFFVIAKRANFSNKTNRVMVVPNELPASETIFEKEGFDYILYPKISPSGEQIAYSIAQAGSNIITHNLFLYDLRSKAEKLIHENGEYPSWSASSEKLVVVSNSQNASAIKEIEIASGSLEEVVSDSFQNYFPVYANADTTLIYFLDSLEEGDQSINSFSLSKEATNPKASLRDINAIEDGQLPLLGMDYSSEENNVAYSVTFPKETAIGFSYDVVGFALASPSALQNLVVSDWNDSNPSFSLTDPNLLAFISDRSGLAQVWIKNVSTQQLIQVTDFQENEWINKAIVGLSWSGEKLFFNSLDVEGVTRVMSINVSSLLRN
ncbi:TolB family protein [Algoriphagus resistens]|uniref:TolB family protein n=1 Tax=Algoriphagus resistens TaxID=1750590 RepID=UPI000716B5B5|nr:fibronectin type III domain-containing protein [Algoriphagus resistens]